VGKIIFGGNKMKPIKIYNRHRRDCWVDLKCEGCGSEQTYKSGYDDHNFWDNVVPNEFKCPECGKTTIDLGAEVQKVMPMYG
jgi:ribosomal protein S27E